MDTSHPLNSGVKEVVRQKYGEAARRVSESARGGCCSPSALAELKAGETVLDLGSGGGIDVLPSARRVGPGGVAYGLDMTDEMLALAQHNKRQSGSSDVYFLKGDIEHIPLPAASVDVIIGNCVINLAADKHRVLAEALRVLEPGGRFAVSDAIARGEVPEAIRRNIALRTGCVAGALSDRDYRDKFTRAGFVDAGIELIRIYGAEDARDFLAAQGSELQQLASEVDGKFASGFMRATKPAAAVAQAAAATASTSCCCTPAAGGGAAAQGGRSSCC